jgi:hypothetical protein
MGDTQRCHWCALPLGACFNSPCAGRRDYNASVIGERPTVAPIAPSGDAIAAQGQPGASATGEPQVLWEGAVDSADEPFRIVAYDDSYDGLAYAIECRWLNRGWVGVSYGDEADAPECAVVAAHLTTLLRASEARVAELVEQRAAAALGLSRALSSLETMETRAREAEAGLATVTAWQDAVVAEVLAHPDLPCDPGEASIEYVPALLAHMTGRIDHADDYEGPPTIIADDATGTTARATTGERNE